MGVPIGVHFRGRPEASRQAVEIDRGDAETAESENTGRYGCFLMPEAG